MDSDEKRIDDYLVIVARTLAGVDVESIKSAVDVLKRAVQMHTPVYVAGNGGSASMSDHFVVDLMKLAGATHVVSLTSNTAVLTAMSNDISYEQAMSAQVAGVDDYVLVAISSSGKSENILRLVRHTQAKRLPVIAISGRREGASNPLLEVDLLTCVPIAIPSGNTQVIEDCTSVILHALARTAGGVR